MLIIISQINNNLSNYQRVMSDMSSHGITCSYSVGTFTIKSPFKFIHNDININTNEKRFDEKLRYKLLSTTDSGKLLH